jgi:carboxyl-terminal processing protease
MWKLLSILLFITVVGVSLAKAQNQASHETVFLETWQKINDTFYDPTFSGRDWNAIRERYRPQVLKAANDKDFQKVMSKMLSELPVSHLWFNFPVRESVAGVGARTRTIEGKEVVTTVGYASDAQRQGLRIGDIILSTKDMYGALGSFATIQVQDCSGHVRSVRIRREKIGQNEKPSIHWGRVVTGDGTSIGYIRALRFDDDAAPEIDEAMADLADTKSLIIDVRENGGGNASFIRLSSYFTGGEHLVAALIMRSYMEKLKRLPNQTDITSLNKSVGAYTDEKIFDAMRSNGGAVALYSEDLGKRRYNGKVVVLIGEDTGSAAEGFAWHMKTKSEAKFIGTTTAGALLGAEYFTLSGGWRLSVPTHAAWGSDGKPVIDKAISPHITTKWTVKDVCEGRDPDIAEALDFFSK